MTKFMTRHERRILRGVIVLAVLYAVLIVAALAIANWGR